MTTAWLEATEWKRIQAVIPIACVDVLAFRSTRQEQTPGDVGLIYRDTPHQGRRWCLIGGRLFHDETIVDAIRRQIRETLGNRVQYDLDEDIQPTYVAQYFPSKRDVGGVDPRQHALGLTYCIAMHGEIIPQGEAFSFSWFNPSALPAAGEFGFDQDQIVATCLERLR